MGTVTPLPSAKPKQETHQYRKHTIVLTYKPIDQVWEWKFEHRPRLHLSGKASTLQSALSLAKREVDNILRGGQDNAG